MDYISRAQALKAARLGEWDSLNPEQRATVDRLRASSSRRVDAMCYRGDGAFAVAGATATVRTFPIEGANTYLWIDDYQAVTAVSDNGTVPVRGPVGDD